MGIVDMTAGLSRAVADRGKQGDAAIAGAMGGVMGAMLERPGAHPYRNEPLKAGYAASDGGGGAGASASSGALAFMGAATGSSPTAQRSATSTSATTTSTSIVVELDASDTGADFSGTATANAAALSPPNLAAAGVLKLATEIPPPQAPASPAAEALPGAPPPL